MGGVSRNVSQKFPDFPDEDDGGSNAIFAKKNVNEIQQDLEAVGVSCLSLYESDWLDGFAESRK